ncbi:MAG: hypothetical protein AAB453_03660, partial [Patescibacteria group bacterium]
MIKLKNFFALLILLTLIFAVSPFAFAIWTPPLGAPPASCASGGVDGCEPINVSSSNQTKTGPLGISNTLVAFTNFFASSTGIGPGFISATPLTINPNAVLDIDGQIAIRTGAGLNKVLTSDANGLASWGSGNWEIINTDDIRNINPGNVGIGTGDVILPAKLTINGSIAKYGNELNGSLAVTATQVNLGNTSTTTGTGSTVSGGSNNYALADYSTVSGGLNNTASGAYSVVSGGQNNTATGTYSVIPGGKDNSTGANYSFAGGNSAKLSALATNTFVWDKTNMPGGGHINTFDAFLIFPSGQGKAGIGVSNPAVSLDVSGGIKTIATGGVTALEVNGPVKLLPNLPLVGYVLTADTVSGDALWKPLDSSQVGGDAVIYIRCKDNGCSTVASGGQLVGGTPLCSGDTHSPFGTWMTAASTTESISSVFNVVRTCYKDTGVAQVIYL